MIKPIMYQQIKKLKEIGLTWSGIASRTGLDVKTVKKYSRMTPEEFQEYYRTYHQRVKCFDFYEPEIIQIFRNANTSRVNASAIYDHLEEKHGDLPASERSFRTYMAYLRLMGKLQVSGERILEPVECLPLGHQMQLDFGEYRMRDGSKLYIFAAILSASRCRYVQLFDRPLTTRDVINSLCDCFAYYNGIPHEIVIDQDHLMVVSENKGDIILTHDFKLFRDEMDFNLYVCRKADPQSKGKVENLVNFVKRSYLSTRSFSDLEEARTRLASWLVRKANGKRCAATNRKPHEHLEEERKFLKPLRNSIFAIGDKTLREPRKVDKLGQISVHGAKMRVPSEYRSRVVSVFISADEVHIFDPVSDEKIALYALKTGLEKIPIARQKSLRLGRYEDLKNKLAGRFRFKEWNQFLNENFKNYRRYFIDQYNDFHRKFSDAPDMQFFEEAVRYCISNQTLSMGQLYDTYNYLKQGNSLQNPVGPAKEYRLLKDHRYQSPVVAKRNISSYMSLMAEKVESESRP
jgi:transposase